MSHKGKILVLEKTHERDEEIRRNSKNLHPAVIPADPANYYSFHKI
jgi:hypothetical protein